MAERITPPHDWGSVALEQLVDSAPVLLWRSRTDGLCTFVNQTWLAFTGRTLEEEWGEGWAENVHDEDLEACMATYGAAFSERRVLEMEYRLRRHDGAYRWILDRRTPCYAADGTFTGYIGSCIDITERRNLETELRAAVEARDDFLSVASHELGTPLTALQLQLEQLRRLLGRRNTEPHDPLAVRVAGIIDQVERLSNLTGNLLDTTRLAAGKSRLAIERVDLSDLVGRVVRRLATVAERSRCRVTIHNRTKVLGRWDAGRLEQTITNLLSNAFKYGAGKPVEITVVGDGTTARVRVADQGIGVEADHKALIFERFGRAAPGQRYGGLGLGLWIARQAVQAMGGEIRVESPPGAGAIFEVALPQTSDLAERQSAAELDVNA